MMVSYDTTSVLDDKIIHVVRAFALKPFYMGK